MNNTIIIITSLGKKILVVMHPSLKVFFLAVEHVSRPVIFSTANYEKIKSN